MKKILLFVLLVMLGASMALWAEDAPLPPAAGSTGEVAPAPVPATPPAATETPAPPADTTHPVAPVTPATPAAPATPVAPVPAPPTTPEPPKVALPPVPTITPDTDIFRRTPVIDGVIESGEWDKYYSFDYNGIKATTYVDWDDKNLYVASRTSAPSDLLVIMDGAADGWFQGSDNFEITAKRAVGDAGPTLSVSRYQSQGVPGVAGAPLVAAESTAFLMKSSTSSDGNVYEIAIPKSAVPGLDLRAGQKVGIKVAVGVGVEDVQWIPAAMLGEVQTANFVATKSSSVMPVEVSVELVDSRIVPGDDLTAKITVRNKSEIVARIDSIVVGGEGKSAKIMGSQLIRQDGLAPGQSFSTKFKTQISRTAVPGSAALGVEARSGDDRIAGALKSFDIVPAYEVSLQTPGTASSAGERRIVVDIKNNTHRSAFGKVKLSVPEGWKLRRSEGEKTFSIQEEDSVCSVVYRITPSDKSAGRVPILAEVQIGDQTLSASGVIEIK